MLAVVVFLLGVAAVVAVAEVGEGVSKINGYFNTPSKSHYLTTI